MTLRSNSVLSLLSVLALLQIAAAITVRSIPSTQDNQDFFSLSQSLISVGDRKFSSCGPDLPEIERCIRICNSPGLAERGGCCCIARQNEFIVGLRGGCRFSQRVQNFTTRFIYKSSPITSTNSFFGKNNCARNVPNGSGGPCTCSIQYEAETSALELTTPLPTPSVSASPVLSATPSPVASPSALPIPAPTGAVETFEPTSEESMTPTPDSELIPVPPGAGTGGDRQPPSGPDTTDESDATDDDPDATPTGDVDGDGDDDSDNGDIESIFGSPDDAEQQASEDDGSVCVDERYLKELGYEADSLVHKEGIMSNVFCPDDRTLPCGTADHKVRLDGEDMSYETMCSRANVECRVTRMKVNSVYSHLWSDVAHEDAMLTMFDVRYGESAQKALHAVMHGWRRVKQRVVGQVLRE